MEGFRVSLSLQNIPGFLHVAGVFPPRLAVLCHPGVLMPSCVCWVLWGLGCKRVSAWCSGKLLILG